MQRFSKVSTSVLACGLLLLGAFSEVSGQTFTGGVRGTVRDANGVIPGVEVTLTNDETTVARSTFTNEVGEYNFSAVSPGSYTLRAILQGFQTSVRSGLRIGTQQFLAIDVVMEVGTVQEEIQVTAAAPLIETSNASQAASLDREVLENLPSPGRAAFLIGITIPTVIATGDPQFNRQQDQTNASLVSLGGGARRANNYIVDGMPVTDLRNRAVINPSIEAIDEVKVQVHTYDAEMGRTGGGVFNTTFRSGSNEFHGSGFYQTRPTSMLTQNWFLQPPANDTTVPLADQFYRLWGAGGGGPIIRNRTFFWVANEGYKSATSRNGNLIFPTNLERQGNFSASGVTIRDPFTGVPFPGNVIPANRIDPVAAALVNFFPTPDSQVSGTASGNQANYVRQSFQVDLADMQTAKVEHKFSDNVSLSGVYFYNRTDEPFAEYWDTNKFADPGALPLKRRIHGTVENLTIIPSDTTVLAFRYGFSNFDDSCLPKTEFDVTTLPFAGSFLNNIQSSNFPSLSIDDIGEISGSTAGPGGKNLIEWRSWGVNGTLSKLVGSHTFKFGADMRHLELNTQPFGQPSGDFTFDGGYSGAPLADFMLGFPRSGFADISTGFEFFTNYFGAYVQDDWRVSSKLTFNYGLRFEYEQGLQEKSNAITVGFDQTAVSPLAALTGLPLVGGPIYAGVGGANDYQGDSPGAKISPRVGLVYSLNQNTVIRGGYGVFWAPWNYQFPGTTNYGQLGFNRRTTMVQPATNPTTTLQNPFPLGLFPALGSSQGLVTGTGGNIEIIDQNKQAPYVQQYSMDVQRELPGNLALTVGYMGATGRDLGMGGTNDGIVNINQIRDVNAALALGSAALNASVPNPFRGIPEAGGFAGASTIERGQLLRPFPQFRNVNLRQVTDGESQYHAFVAKLDKRLGNSGWGGTFSYTRSVLKDNQFAESNLYVDRDGLPQNNYDTAAEYAHGLLHMPNKIILAPIFQLPFGQGRKYANENKAADLIIGGWSVSAVVQLESGFPTSPNYSTGFTNRNAQLFGNTTLRPNLTGTDPVRSGSIEDTVLAGSWVNPAAYSQPAAGTLGTAPRTDADALSPFRKNIDVVLTKSFRTGGSTKADIRFELLNLTNTPKFRSYNTTLDQGSFGLITRQAGFMRITQISFRFTF